MQSSSNTVKAKSFSSGKEETEHQKVKDLLHHKHDGGLLKGGVLAAIADNVNTALLVLHQTLVRADRRDFFKHY